MKNSTPGFSRRFSFARQRRLLTFTLALLASAPVAADEGMWTLDHFPSAQVGAEYGFAPDASWLDRIRASAVRLTSGCSASIVSKDGLVLTNHHCVADCAQALSTPKHNFVTDGFAARSRREERLCPGMQAEVLGQISDATDEVLGAIKAAGTQDVIKARDSAMVAIEDRGCRDDSQARCQVVSLYGGGQYKLYKYRKYADVRLVFAPEISIAFFGGDPDNFNFPRYCLDSAFVRLYDGGRPASTPSHLTWRKTAPAAGELVFVAGNPGSTSRLETIAQTQMDRDWTIPVRQLVRSELRGRLLDYADRGAEQKRTATFVLFAVENSFKAFYGIERALLDPDFFARKVREEQELRAKVSANAELASAVGDPWVDITAAIERYQALFLSHDFLEVRAGSVSQLYGYARTLVRAAAERKKPSAERLPEYSDSKLELLEKELLDAQPVYPGIERIGLTMWLSKTREYLTVDNPLVTHLLGQQSPEALANQLVAGTRLADPKVRNALWRGGESAIEASSDPLIRFVRLTDADARALRLRYQQQIEGPITNAAERIARARFGIYGDSVYPDATFTLRLSYGRVDGWTYQGNTVAPFTDFGGLYARATAAEPFRLPKRWLDAKSRLDPAVALNVSTSNDIIGGNSGSPLIDAQGRVAGAIFDGNIHSLGGDYGYDPRLNRSIAVLTSAIGAALRHVYSAPALADELEADSN
jgi:hypothetical protein